MKLVANIYELDQNADDGKIGEVVLENGVLTVSPDTDQMRALIATHIMVGNEEIRPKRDPEAFVRGLCQNYRSPYFRAGVATERE